MTLATTSSEQISAVASSDRIAVSIGEQSVAALIPIRQAVSVDVKAGFGATGATGPQGPASGISSISQASDVSLSGIKQGDVLRYDSGRWRNYADIGLTDGGNF